jgi:acyl-coenzyme A thioesterase 9
MYARTYTHTHTHRELTHTEKNKHMKSQRPNDISLMASIRMAHLLRLRLDPLRWSRLLTGSVRNKGSSIQSITDHAHVEKTPITSQLWEQRRVLLEKEGAKLGTSPVEAPTIIEKAVDASRMSVQYKFTEDAFLRHLYLDSSGDIQIGKLLEDLDALAGNIAASHCDDHNSRSTPLNLVTASVDKIVQMQPITMSKDYVLLGQMAYVGRSSMDIMIQMHPASNIDPVTGAVRDSRARVLHSFFTFAARDFTTGKAALVNKLRPETLEEKEVYAQREKLAIDRKNKPPVSTLSEACRDMLTPLVERGSAIVDMPALAHPNAVLMSHTEMENCFISQPQKVNTAGSIFGVS